MRVWTQSWKCLTATHPELRRHWPGRPAISTYCQLYRHGSGSGQRRSDGEHSSTRTFGRQTYELNALAAFPWTLTQHLSWQLLYQADVYRPCVVLGLYLLHITVNRMKVPELAACCWIFMQ